MEPEPVKEINKNGPFLEGVGVKSQWPGTSEKRAGSPKPKLSGKYTLVIIFCLEACTLNK